MIIAFCIQQVDNAVPNDDVIDLSSGAKVGRDFTPP